MAGMIQTQAVNGTTPSTGETIGELGARVIFDQIEKRYGSVIAVDGVSLNVAPGEFVTLLGPSGSGKTTTLMMLAGFEIPTAGEIYVDEDPIRSEENTSELQSRLHLVCRLLLEKKKTHTIKHH